MNLVHNLHNVKCTENASVSKGARLTTYPSTAHNLFSSGGSGSEASTSTFIEVIF